MKSIRQGFISASLNEWALSEVEVVNKLKSHRMFYSALWVGVQKMVIPTIDE
jgi:hypothetical protein